MLGWFKRDKKQNAQQVNKHAPTSQHVGEDKILNDYINKRFSPLDLDLTQLDLSGDSHKNKDNLHIIKHALKHSKIPIYTGNPFNPYF